MKDDIAELLAQMRVSAKDACGFVEGMSREEFFADKRTQQAVVMSLVIVGEAAARVMDRARLLRTRSRHCLGHGRICTPRLA